MNINLQIIPSPFSDLGHQVQLPSYETDPVASLQSCLHCGGEGKVFWGEECGKCGGKGERYFVVARRIDVTNEREKEDAEALLDSLSRDTCRWQVTVRLHERGSGYTNTGDATVVCGLLGEPLPAVHTDWRCGRNNATFYVHAALVVQYSHRRGEGQGLVTLVGIDSDARHRLGVERIPLWRFWDSGTVEVLNPERARAFEFPESAIAAARSKARTYHARGAYYAANSSPGPAGAMRGAGAATGGLPSPFKGPGIGYTPEN